MLCDLILVKVLFEVLATRICFLAIYFFYFSLVTHHLFFLALLDEFFMIFGARVSKLVSPTRSNLYTSEIDIRYYKV